MKAIFSFTPILILAAFAHPAFALDLTNFEACIQQTPSITMVYCQLDPNTAPGTGGVWTLSHTLEIKRSNVTLMSSVGSVTMKRDNSMGAASMIFADAQLTDIYITSLTFDGNRAGANSCPSANYSYWELNLSLVGTAEVDHIDVVNSMSQALFLGRDSSAVPTLHDLPLIPLSTSSVSYSNFGQTGSTSGGANTSITLAGDYTGAYFNNIAYAGTAALGMPFGHGD